MKSTHIIANNNARYKTDLPKAMFIFTQHAYLFTPCSCSCYANSDVKLRPPTGENKYQCQLTNLLSHKLYCNTNNYVIKDKITDAGSQNVQR